MWKILTFSNFISLARGTFENHTVLGEPACFSFSIFRRLAAGKKGGVLRVEASTGLAESEVVDVQKVELEFRLFDMLVVTNMALVPEAQVDPLGVSLEVLDPLELLRAVLTWVLLDRLVFVVYLLHVPRELALGREGL